MLDLIVPFSNPLEWSSRLRNYRRFEDAVVGTPGVSLITVELAYGERPFILQPREGVRRIQRRTTDVLWHKENLINIGETYSTSDHCGYSDGDILFFDPDWAVKTVSALQLYPIVQVTTSLVNLGPPPAEEAIRVIPSFVSVYNQDYSFHRVEWFNNGTPPSLTRHGYPGGCWAWRKLTYHDMGGLLERCILGSADYHMAHGLLGLTTDPVVNNHDYTVAYRDYIREWGQQALYAAGGSVGTVPGTAFHLWHGRSDDRGYHTRPRILVRNRYDPSFDVRKRHDGILELTDKPLLRRDLMDYFASRHEDSIDTEVTDRSRQRHAMPTPRGPAPPPPSHHPPIEYPNNARR